MIYTFYSYKGGVGRSMALANVAELLYREGLRVLMVDWDLEAPGLGQYFQEVCANSISDKPGVIDLLLEYKRKMAQDLSTAGIEKDELPFEKPNNFVVEIYPSVPGKGQLWLLPSGRHSKEYFAEYAHDVHSFDWEDFYQNWEGELYFEWLREQFKQMADVVLIDSRTGVTEMGGVCTYHLADVVVMFCSANQQSLDGTYEMAQSFRQHKVRQLRGDRPLEVLVIPARVEDRSEIERLNEFRDQFVEKFGLFLPEGLQSPRELLWELKIPHVPYYAFKEIVAVREEEQKRSEDMVAAFALLTRVLKRLAGLEAEGELWLPKSKFLSIEETMNIYLATDDWDKAAALLDDKLEFLYDTGHALTLNDWLSQFPRKKLEQYPRLLLLRGRILNDDLSQPNLAMTFFNQAEEQFLKLGDLIGVAKAQIWQSVGLRMMGKAKEGLELASKALEQVKTLAGDNGWMIALATRNRGLAYGTAGNIEKALPDIYQALERFEALGDTYRIGLCHHDIGVSLEKRGNVKEAEHHYGQAIEIWQKLGNDNDLANSLTGLGRILCMTGRYDEALQRLNESLDIALRIGATRRAAFAQAYIGDAHLGRQEYDQAAKAYTISTAYAQEAGARSLEIYNQVKMGECSYYYFRQPHNLTDVLQWATHAKEFAAENGLIFEKGLACTLLGKVYVRQGDYTTSFSLFAEAVACFTENNMLEQAKARLWWGYSLWLNQQLSAAFEQLQQALSLVPELGTLAPQLAQTVTEVEPLLLHFLHYADIPAEMRESIYLLLTPSQLNIEISRPES